MASPNLLALTSLQEVLLSVHCPATTGAEVAYVVPAGESVKVTTAILCNNSGAAVTVNLHVVPAGDSPAAANKVIANYSIGAYDTVNLTDTLGGLMIGEGDGIQIQIGTANAVVLTLSGAVAA
jgi:hypothetical protein